MQQQAKPVFRTSGARFSATVLEREEAALAATRRRLRRFQAVVDSKNGIYDNQLLWEPLRTGFNNRQDAINWAQKRAQLLEERALALGPLARRRSLEF